MCRPCWASRTFLLSSVGCLINSGLTWKARSNNNSFFVDLHQVYATPIINTNKEYTDGTSFHILKKIDAVFQKMSTCCTLSSLDYRNENFFYWIRYTWKTITDWITQTKSCATWHFLKCDQLLRQNCICTVLFADCKPS